MTTNDRNSSSAASGGIGFTGALQLIFIVLKLCGVIKWSWLWVLAPTWIPVIILVIFVILYAIVMK